LLACVGHLKENDVQHIIQRLPNGAVWCLLMSVFIVTALTTVLKGGVFLLRGMTSSGLPETDAHWWFVATVVSFVILYGWERHRGIS
jgi:hypothetical protein